MSFYAGLHALDGELGQRYEDQTFAVPGQVKDELITVARMVNLLDPQVRAALRAGKVSDTFGREWEDLRTEWTEFAKSKEGWTAKLWYANYRKALDFRLRVEKVRNALAEAFKVVPWPPAPRTPGTAPVGPADKPPQGSTIPVGALLGVLGGLAGLGVVAWAVAKRRDEDNPGHGKRRDNPGHGETFAYRGYLVKRNPFSGHWAITKGGSGIALSPSAGIARATIDQLVGAA